MPEIDHREFLELLPFYVNGTLDVQQRGRIDAYLAAHPAAQGELTFQAALRDEVRASVPQADSRVGLDRILRGMETGADVRVGMRFRSWVDRALGWIPSANMAPAFAAACMVVVVQAAVLAGLMLRQDEGYDTLRGGGVAGREEAVVQVLFRPDTPESELRSLVRQVEGRIVDGPSDLGFFHVGIPAMQAEQALAQMRASPWVQDAQSVAKRPRN